MTTSGTQFFRILLCFLLISSASHAQDLDEEAQAPETSPEQSSPTNPEAIPGEPVPDEKAVTLPDPKIVPEAVPLTSPSSAAEMSPPTSTAEQEDFNSPDATPTPVPNSKALEESGLSNPSGTGEYRRPLLFAPEDNGLKLTSPQIRWSMLRGTRINMGGLRVDANDIEVVMGSSLSFRWPEILSRIGTVSIETADGKRLWQKAVATEARREWNQVLKSAQADEISPHSKSLWGMIDIDPKIESFLGNGTQYRVCLSRKNSRLQRLKICSESFTAKKIGQAWKMRPVKSDLEANVYYMGKPISQSGLLNFPAKKEILLKIVFNNGSFFEIASQPMSLKLLDVVESKDGREVILTGSGEMPLGRKKIINQPETHFWSATGLDQEVIWQIAIPQEAPTVRVLGAFNVPFTYLFSYDRLPKESDRVFIKERASTGAFSATPLIYGFTGRADKILSKEKSAKKTSAKFFEWTFAAPEKGEDNKARVTLIHSKDKEKWVAHHTVYRGYPFEASARLSGVASATGSLVIIGEAAASAWFEHLGFTQNDTFARQRWGVTSRYFKALQPFKSNNRTIDTFTALNFDLKYNLLRGVWNRDELFGLIASVQSLSLDTTSANLAGFGFYWARTMPRIFNQAIELLPYFDYSKYVDLELVYYPLSLTNTIQAGGSFNLNFHGKVFWTKRVYGEAGFGLKKFEYADKTNNNVVSFASTYGTVGLGVIF